MNNRYPYVMRDQVKDLVPSIMQLGPLGRSRPRRSFTELAIFAAVTLGYLVALTLTA